MTNRLTSNIRQLKSKIAQLSEQQLSAKPNPKKWSRKEILGHLIDSALHNLKRFNEIIHAASLYEIESYDQNALVKSNRYQEAEINALILLWESLNKQIAHIVEDLPPEVWAKQIKTDDEIHSFQWLVEDYVRHLEYHLQQILAGTSALNNLTRQHLSLQKAIQQLSTSPTEFATVFRFNDLEIEYYKPHQVDRQQPHDRDEVYVIASGSGTFHLANETFNIQAPDVLFVEAGMEHRFVDFTNDFATWVVFYGNKR